jgi:hypothetical protein
VQAAGLLERASEDVDLFTAWERRADFDAALNAIVAGYDAAGLSVEVQRRSETFARLSVSDGVHLSAVELAVDWRANHPIQMTIGPVLHPDDAVANKMSALYGRAQARDFIDIYAAIRSGRYDEGTLLRLAERADRGFDHRLFAEALSRAEVLDTATYARYGVSGQYLDQLRAHFGRWRAQLLGHGN